MKTSYIRNPSLEIYCIILSCSAKKTSRSQSSLNSFQSKTSPGLQFQQTTNGIIPGRHRKCSLDRGQLTSATLTPKLRHANTINSLTFETAELLGTPNSKNHLWEESSQENSETVEKKKSFNLHIHINEFKRLFYLVANFLHKMIDLMPYKGSTNGRN